MKFTYLKHSVKLFSIFLFIILSSCGKNSQKSFGGLALYTVRDDMKKSTEATLDSVANAGYQYVEAAGYHNGQFYNMSPEAFKDLLTKKGLNPISSHQGSATLDNIDAQIADVKAAGFTYFVIPVPPMGHFKYNEETKTMSMDADLDFMVDFLTTVGKKCKEAGLQLLYHNHDFEFKADENGVVPIDYFLEHTDPEYVNFQMDLFWVTKAGADPVKYFEKYPGRFKLWHVKDMSEDGKFAPVGKGTIDFGKILAKKELSGMEYYFVEQDQTFDHTPLEAIKISHNGLKDFGFE